MRIGAMALLMTLAATAARGDLVTATFEDRYPGADAVAIDFRAGGDRFESDGFGFSNHYVPPGGGFAEFYSGFGVSSRVDNVPVNDPFGSSDYDHALGAYSPAPGGSPTYAVAFNYFVGDAVVDLPAGSEPASIDVANTTYMASVILFGDAFSRPAQAGDFVRIDIIGFAGPGATGAQVGTVPFFLADFRFGSLALVDRFTTVDLAALAGARSLAFAIDTNITNSFGPSIPFTFAVDNVVAARIVPEPSDVALLGVGIVLAAGWRFARRR